MKRQHSYADFFRWQIAEATRKQSRRMHNPAVLDGTKDDCCASYDCVQRDWSIG